MKVNLEKSGLERACDILALTGLVLFVVLIAIYWSKLPATIPIHFNLGGEADGWGRKATILVLPGIALFIYVTMTLAIQSSKDINYPVRITPENAERQYRLVRHLLAVMKVAVIWGLLGMTWLILQTALSEGAQLGSWPAFVLVGSVFAILGGYFVAAFKK
ncbi:MAG: DUF1648 domain-containing protein [Saprospiraceae bacterium]|nr:DUF1648 domain-containing protein [Saprospiraceae bacterium]MDZ4706073.1 DUF1648 domain-containing protein [Saprospiraceae bacterium]